MSGLMTSQHATPGMSTQGAAGAVQDLQWRWQQVMVDHQNLLLENTPGYGLISGDAIGACQNIEFCDYCQGH